MACATFLFVVVVNVDKEPLPQEEGGDRLYSINYLSLYIHLKGAASHQLNGTPVLLKNGLQSFELKTRAKTSFARTFVRALNSIFLIRSSG